jgi:hypothetical protein
MPSMPKGNSGLPCRPAHPRAVGFLVMSDRRTENRVVEPLCARAHAPARPVSLLHVLLAHSPLRFAPNRCVKDCAVFSRTTVLLRLLRPTSSSNPHKRTSLLYPTL